MIVYKEAYTLECFEKSNTCSSVIYQNIDRYHVKKFTKKNKHAGILYNNVEPLNHIAMMQN